MGNYYSREVTYNWKIEDLHGIEPEWLNSETFGFPDDDFVSFCVFATTSQRWLGWDCWNYHVKILLHGLIKNKADISLKINDSELKHMNMINWNNYSEEFIFEAAHFQPPHNITCTIKIHKDNNILALVKASQELANVQDYFLSPELSDISIKVGEEEYPAHKLVLACHSMVFKKMLDTEMKEKQENCIDLSEFDAKTIKEVIRFLYGREIETNDLDLLLKLSSFAHMYQINRLKDYCESKLLTSFQVDNIVKILVTIDNYDMDKVKNQAMKFLKKNKSDVSFSDVIDNIKNSTVLWNFLANLAEMKK
ncbi:BTB/POZ and MATH domain-containing protein 3-like [Cotesia glomerata]|uniref:BTB/POZ and MATH domain-containing protein 3-like n=1 Tax=Cotesia glomerata TaxID=32391 RepID=UPI001D02D90D|nr:BTB/POZ and MATH domain-containing protein 3-like [Cotesia glomerata]XP_044596537.1 BTB/POZ and MATH domain-containing protein 3-like [Cotesia glomerata]XP_044596538.1 BTB/POZ and MATH domain-containing protein 3-like [Cotesia glomerata]XP_044596539.1 BTB/POZ and MATH domain-containing protein 3-like [Cotesia glomerata]XP_044596541.1 BTB/POZ and MATH domain-containing protein 3-like [Cotesia glomerata]XP_044596542.1 BTB/POZ and MATH domain-containing protein 3-like [Cotesia glomerata]